MFSETILYSLLTLFLNSIKLLYNKENWDLLLERYTDKADEPKLTWVYHPAGRVSKEKKTARFDEIVKDI